MYEPETETSERSERKRREQPLSEAESGKRPTSPKPESSYFRAVLDLLVNDFLLCSIRLAEGEIEGQAVAWADYLSRRIPYERLGGCFMVAAENRAVPNRPLSSVDVVQAWRETERAEAFAREQSTTLQRSCNFCNGVGRKLIYFSATDSEEWRICPRCHPQRASEQAPPLAAPTLATVENVLTRLRLPQEGAVMATQGLCPSCFDSGYLQARRDERWGVLYRHEGYDAKGQEIIRLVPCECAKGQAKAGAAGRK